MAPAPPTSFFLPLQIRPEISPPTSTSAPAAPSPEISLSSKQLRSHLSPSTPVRARPPLPLCASSASSSASSSPMAPHLCSRSPYSPPISAASSSPPPLSSSSSPTVTATSSSTSDPTSSATSLSARSPSSATTRASLPRPPELRQLLLPQPSFLLLSPVLTSSMATSSPNSRFLLHCRNPSPEFHCRASLPDLRAVVTFIVGIPIRSINTCREFLSSFPLHCQAVPHLLLACTLPRTPSTPSSMTRDTITKLRSPCLILRAEPTPGTCQIIYMMGDLQSYIAGTCALLELGQLEILIGSFHQIQASVPVAVEDPALPGYQCRSSDWHLWFRRAMTLGYSEEQGSR